MVSVTFKLTEQGIVTLELEGPMPLSQVIDQCAEKAGLAVGGVIVVREGKVMSLDDDVYPEDIIDVFPAISGG